MPSGNDPIFLRSNHTVKELLYPRDVFFLKLGGFY